MFDDDSDSSSVEDQKQLKSLQQTVPLDSSDVEVAAGGYRFSPCTSSYNPQLDVWGSSRFTMEDVLPLSYFDKLEKQNNKRYFLNKSASGVNKYVDMGLDLSTTSESSRVLLPGCNLPVTIQIKPLPSGLERSDGFVKTRSYKFSILINSQSTYTRFLRVNAKCCVSLVTVTPSVLNLADCPLGTNPRPLVQSDINLTFSMITVYES